MKPNDYFALAGHVATRNWKSLIVVTVALVSVLFLLILGMTMGYNIIDYNMQVQEENYRRDGGKLNINIKCSDAREFDAEMSKLLPHVINNISGEWTATANWIRPYIGSERVDIQARITKNSGESEKGKIYLSPLDKIKCEANLGIKLNIGDTVPMTTSDFPIDNQPLIAIPVVFAGIDSQSYIDVYTLKGEYLPYSNNINSVSNYGIVMNFPANMPKKELNRNINKIIKDLPKDINIDRAINSLDDTQDNAGIAIIAFMITAIIIIIGMVSLSIIGSYLYMQIVKDGSLFAILRVSGMTKTKLAIVEFIPLVAVVIASTIIGALIMLAFVSVITQLLGLLYPNSELLLTPKAKYPIWIPFACGGAMLAMLLLNIPKFAKKFEASKMLKILRERDL